MTRWLILLLLPALAACSGLSGVLKPSVSISETALRPGAYRNDPDHTALVFSLDHMGLSTLTGRFDDVEASLDFDEADPQAAQLDVLIAMDSLALGQSTFRDALLGPDWFDVGTFPVARFTATAITVTGPASADVDGELTLHGVTAPATLAVSFNGGALVPLTGAYTLGFDATTTISRSAFGLGRYGALVGDEVTIAYSGEFRRQ